MSRNTPCGEVGNSVQEEETAQIKAQHTETSWRACKISTSSVQLQCGLRERSWWGMRLKKWVGAPNFSQVGKEREYWPLVQRRLYGAADHESPGPGVLFTQSEPFQDHNTLCITKSLHAWCSWFPSEKCGIVIIIPIYWIKKLRPTKLQELVQNHSRAQVFPS